MSSEWAKLRAWNGSQADGFEELCAQLASEYAPAEASFERVGNPDGGVECYCEFIDGTKWAWQAKYFLPALGETQWRQLDRSVRTALTVHPSLRLYIVCLPRNLSHAPRENIRTEKQKWQDRVAKWREWATSQGMDVEFELWDETQLLQRLSRPECGGRREFWFGDPGQFSDAWLRSRAEAAIKTAGPRYTPEIHVELPIAKQFGVFGRTDAAAASVRELAEDIRRGLSDLERIVAKDSQHDALLQLQELIKTIQGISRQFDGHRYLPNENWNLTAIRTAVQATHSLYGPSRTELMVTAETHRQQVLEQMEGITSRRNPFDEALRTLDALEETAWGVSAALEDMEDTADGCLMIVNGQAGMGKTHLLCDVARRRIDKGCPTVLLMGQQFTTSEPPWTQALQQLDLAHLSIDTFVGALESAAQASGCRALLMVDAVNEARDHGLWNTHLASFLAPIEASPWIGVVLSVRTTYAHHILPQEVWASAAEVRHEGFAGHVHDAAGDFFNYYEIEFPSVPLIQPEFNNPLFLKALCAGLAGSNTSQVPIGSEGVAQVFDRYVDEHNRQIAERLDVDPTEQVVSRALEMLAEACVRNSSRSIIRDEIRDHINSLLPSKGFSDSLYRALVDADLLSEFEGGGNQRRWHVTFGYEWFADHRIASFLISEHPDISSLAEALSDAGTLEGVASLVIHSGLLDALCIHAAERYGEELPGLLPDGLDSSDTRSAFIRSLVWRDPSTIGQQSKELVNGLFVDERSGGLGEIFDVLVACAVVPNHPLGADYLDERLRSLRLPDRDEVWSTHLHRAYGSQGPLDRMLDWAEQYTSTMSLDDAARGACAVVLAWFLTASDRFVRDRATKGLIAILSDQPLATSDWVRQFHDVDDPYVCERMYAVAYGVAMRTADAASLAPLAQTVYETVFSEDAPPVHVLLRDYARGVVERAIHLGSDLDIVVQRVRPPYRSTWPHIPSDEALQELNPSSGEPRRELSGDEIAQARLSSSVMRSDFARYVIGTNSASESREWLEIALSEPRWRSLEEMADIFADTLGPISRQIYQKLRTRVRPSTPSNLLRDLLENSNIDASSEAPRTFLDPVIDTPYHDEQLERMLVRILRQEQIGQYEEMKSARSTPAPRFRLDIIQRYVLWRAFDLGWTAERFGDFDLATGGGPSHVTRKAERIGKKYQWIGYHEILAYIADNFQFRSGYKDTGMTTEYMGAWQMRVRDIDPSIVSARIERRRTSSDGTTKWWNRSVLIPTIDEIRHEDWLHKEEDIPDRDSQLYFQDSDRGTVWIKVHGFKTWESPAPLVDVSENVDYRELWLDAYGYFIDVSRVDEFLAWSRSVDFWNRWMTEPPGSYDLFFGELGWAPGFEDLLGAYLESQHPEPWADGAPCPVPLCPAAYQHVAEAAGYDCSLTNSQSMLRPNSALVSAMGLQWTGEGADFVDSEGNLVAFDPSTYDDCSSALLIRGDCLSQYLEESGRALVWAIVGEKRAREPGDWSNCWAASVRRSGAYVYGDDPSRGHMQTFVEPPTGVRTA